MNKKFKEKPSYRAVVVGCGFIGGGLPGRFNTGIHSHAQAYDQNPRTDLVGVCDINPRRLADARKRWNVKTSVDPIGLCRQVKPDIVSLCTPDKTHFRLGMSILMRYSPRILFIEKPLAVKLTQAKKILRLARQRNVAIAVNYSRRYSSVVQKLKSNLDQGRYGKPRFIHMFYGKGLLHNGSHALDLMRYLIGEPRWVKAGASQGGLGADKTYDVDLVFRNGCRGKLTGFDERVATVFEMDLFTDKERIQFSLGGRVWTSSALARNKIVKGYAFYHPRKGHNGKESSLGDCLENAINNLVAFLDRKNPLLCTGQDGYEVLSLINKIRGFN